MVNKLLNKFTVLVVMLLWVIVSSPGCSLFQSTDPIKIGFAGELTGARSSMSVDARDSIQLAIDSINEAGGIAGRPLTLIVKDDQGDPDMARQVDAELVEEGVVAIIGHITSGQTAAVWEQMNAAQVVLISPGASSSQFSGKADYFFRTVPSTDLIGKAMAVHIFQSHAPEQVTCIYDSNNSAFAEPLWQAIQKELMDCGSDAKHAFTFKPGETDLKALMTEVKTTTPEVIVFIASPVDTALMAQYSQQLDLKAHLFASSWAHSNVLLEKGGRAVEGLELAAYYDPESTYPGFQPFVERFEARYERTPGMMAANAYETMLTLAEGLRQTQGHVDGLPEALTKVTGLEGVRDEISLDMYGDIQRDVHIMVVKNGEFELQNIVTSED